MPDERLMKSKFCNLNNMRDDRTRNRDKRKWDIAYDSIAWNSKKNKQTNKNKEKKT